MSPNIELPYPRFAWRMIEITPGRDGERYILAQGAGDAKPRSYELQPDGSVRIEYWDGQWVRINQPVIAGLGEFGLEVRRTGVDPNWQTVCRTDESDYL